MTDALLADLRALAEECLDEEGDPFDKSYAYRFVSGTLNLIAKHETQPDVSERDELAQVLHKQRCRRCAMNWRCGGIDHGDQEDADALLAAGWRKR